MGVIAADNDTKKVKVTKPMGVKYPITAPNRKFCSDGTPNPNYRPESKPTYPPAPPKKKS